MKKVVIYFKFFIALCRNFIGLKSLRCIANYPHRSGIWSPSGACYILKWNFVTNSYLFLLFLFIFVLLVDILRQPPISC